MMPMTSTVHQINESPAFSVIIASNTSTTNVFYYTPVTRAMWTPVRVSATEVLSVRISSRGNVCTSTLMIKKTRSTSEVPPRVYQIRPFHPAISL
jgi:hypothetical protein